MAKTSSPAKSNTPDVRSEQSTAHVHAALPRRWRLKVGADGRVVIPAAARAAMDLGADGRVTAYLEGGELRMISPNVALRQMQEFIRLHDKGEGSVVDELIAERRAAAARGD